MPRREGAMSYGRTIAITAALACGPGAAAGTDAAHRKSDELVERLVAAAERAVDEYGVPGLAIGVSVGSDTILDKR